MSALERKAKVAERRSAIDGAATASAEATECPMFEHEDWTLFRNLGTLGQKAGVAQDDIPRLVAKELADNALDAAGACEVGLLPDGGMYVEDEGAGIPGDADKIGGLFSVNRPLRSSKVFRLPSRKMTRFSASRARVGRPSRARWALGAWHEFNQTCYQRKDPYE
jgi:hypothetical protein